MVSPIPVSIDSASAFEELRPPAVPGILLHELRDLPKRVGIFGGTFDPVHEGHVAAALAALYAHSLDMVIFLPSGGHWLKPVPPLYSKNERLDLLLNAAARIPQLYISTYEIEKPRPYLTIDTLLQVKRDNPETELFFILGMDNAQRLHEWLRMDDYRATVQFIPIGRNGLAPEFPNTDRWLEEQLINNFVPLDVPISSTEIRSRRSQ